ncbi:NKG2-A NKG2-B type II integral membrane protein-like [Sigmodon hispidus]
MSNEGVIYGELKVVNNTRNQKRKPRDTLSSISVTEQEITYMEFSFQNVSHEHPPVFKDCCCKGFLSPPEKLITGILGIIGFALMVAVIIITTVAIPYPEAKAQINSSQTRIQRDNNLSSVHPCDHCPKEWISYSHNCYYISMEKKTWNDSLMSCTSKSSALIYIDSEEEQDFLQLLSLVSWTGVFRKSRDQHWVWKNESAFKQNIKEVSHDEHNCVIVSTDHFQAEKCTALHAYLCKRKLIT